MSFFRAGNMTWTVAELGRHLQFEANFGPPSKPYRPRIHCCGTMDCNMPRHCGGIVVSGGSDAGTGLIPD